MVNENNKAQIVEIRYLEKQETTQSNKFLRSVLPTAYCMPDDDGKGGSSFRGPSVGVGIEAKADLNSTGVMVKTGVDLSSVKAGGVKARVGLNTDTGATAGTDGVEVKAIGFGVSVGRKTGISTPLGEVSVNTDDCAIQ